MRSVLAICVVWAPLGRAGVPGALPALFSEQCVPVTMTELALAGTTIGVDVAGKLAPLVLGVGALVDRGLPAKSHYDAMHKWLVDLLSSGVLLLLVFDSFTARYPPKAAKHEERAAESLRHRVEAEKLDAAHASGVDSAADKHWNKARRLPTEL